VSPFEEFLGRGEVCHPPPVPRPAARFKFLHQNPYLHDERLLTLDDTVEFFNLILGVKLTPQEKEDLVAFLRAL
jgi:cytochrome c peroxidase